MAQWLSADERHALSRLTDAALGVLGFLFIALLALRYAGELSAAEVRRVHLVGWIIWVLFAVNFFVRLAYAPDKLRFLRTHWITTLGLLLPSFGILHIVRLLAGPGAFGASNVLLALAHVRRAVGRFLAMRGIGYVLALSVVVLILGALAETLIEHDAPRTEITSFGEALWFTATTLTTVGSNDDPVTVEGRIVAVLLQLYGISVTAYITAAVAATLAAFLVSHGMSTDAGEGDGEGASRPTPAAPDQPPKAGE